MDKPLQSETISDLIKALVLAQISIGHAKFNATNPHFDNDYASLESVIDATKKILAEQKLVVIQQPYGNILVTTLAHESGQWMRSYTNILMDKQTAQGQGSGLTYVRRYALAAMLGIGQEDDDGNKASEPAKVPPKAIPSQADKTGLVKAPQSKSIVKPKAIPSKPSNEPPPWDSPIDPKEGW